MEMYTGAPLFPGDSDVDQLWLILKCLGGLAPQHLATLQTNSAFKVYVGGNGGLALTSLSAQAYNPQCQSAFQAQTLPVCCWQLMCTVSRHAFLKVILQPVRALIPLQLAPTKHLLNAAGYANTGSA